MTFPDDVPDLLIKKPKQLEELESMDRVFLDSMLPTEVQEKVEEIAHAVAAAYQQQKKNGNYDECKETVAVALSVTGSAIGGHVGNALIAASESAAKRSCSAIYPPEY